MPHKYAPKYNTYDDKFKVTIAYGQPMDKLHNLQELVKSTGSLLGRLGLETAGSYQISQA
jgi:hypothetical protein